jgi:hypothetical protein
LPTEYVKTPNTRKKYVDYAAKLNFTVGKKQLQGVGHGHRLPTCSERLHLRKCRNSSNKSSSEQISVETDHHDRID